MSLSFFFAFSDIDFTWDMHQLTQPIERKHYRFVYDEHDELVGLECVNPQPHRKTDTAGATETERGGDHDDDEKRANGEEEEEEEEEEDTADIDDHLVELDDTEEPLNAHAERMEMDAMAAAQLEFSRHARETGFLPKGVLLSSSSSHKFSEE